ncbi:choice-of-anchor Q domain-containing protein [Marinicella litoralis]|uniref:Putative outer membrane repeat protein n=1 Tax=Marinicella litoralis TaxID=644220 RepID=A0A4R6XV34_9GAMM|nr:choice-of-anchor Q domain-containing protein [Marinicella litoralis]TDR23872.1 putative outer membrane repeat protein [Marinicella litoralis]
MYKIFISFIFMFFIQCTQAQDNTQIFVVNAGDNQGLIAAIESANNNTAAAKIFIQPGPAGETSFTFTEAYMGTDNALPVISSVVQIVTTPAAQNRITLKRDINAPQFRLLEVSGHGRLGMNGFINVESFSVNGNGGAILAGDETTVQCRGTNFRNNFASGEGGAIYMGGESELMCINTFGYRNDFGGEFRENRAGTVGGAISIQGQSRAVIKHQVFADNSAGVFGCDLNLNSSINATFSTLTVENNTFSADCNNVLFENPRGRMSFRNNSVVGRGDIFDSTDTINFFGNLFDAISTSTNNKTSGILKALCNDFGTDAFHSLGYNISTENSCGLDQSTDLPDTDPMVNLPDEHDVIALKAGSPAIDAGASMMQDNPDGVDYLPCGYIDARGLGRPQDANGDGVFECDMGYYEVQGGPDITEAQSGLYFDTDRNGEGVHVEMLGDDSALVAMFTYHPNQTDLMWFVGSGSRMGNSIVIDEVYRASGGAFGAAFDASNIQNEFVGSMSLVFPDCEATDKPGRMVFESNKEMEEPLENLLVEAFTLSRLLTCAQTQPSEKIGRSGSFFDPQRSGEGIFIDVIDDNTAVVFFYTYTPSGEQFWLVGSGASINGNTITANMLYPTATTGFGSQFNSNEIQFSSWGEVTITHKPGCNEIDISYHSTVSGYGSGELNHVRLTQPAGITCDL